MNVININLELPLLTKIRFLSTTLIAYQNLHGHINQFEEPVMSYQ